MQDKVVQGAALLNVRTLPEEADGGSIRRLLTMSWAHFLNDGAANYLPGVLPAILLHLHIHVALAGSIMAALLMGQALQPLYGWLADRLGGRTFIIVGIVGTATGGALIGIVPGYWSLIGVLMIIGVTSSMFHPQALAAVRQLSGKRRGLVMSGFLVGGELGRGIWPMLASLVVVSYGLKASWLLAVPALLTLPLLWYCVPMQPPRHPDLPPIAWRQHRKDLAIVIGFSALRATLIFSLVTFIPLIWHQQGGSLISGASLITTLLVSGIIGNLGGGHLADRLGRRPVVIIASILSTLLLVVSLLVSGVVLWLSLAGLGVSIFATVPLTVLMGQDILPENPSLGSGLVLGLANGLGAVALMVFGLLALRWDTRAVLWLNVGLTAASVVLAFYLPGDKRGRSRAA